MGQIALLVAQRYKYKSLVLLVAPLPSMGDPWCLPQTHQQSRKNWICKFLNQYHPDIAQAWRNPRTAGNSINGCTWSNYRKGLKTIVALLPLLGVTFLLGFFSHLHVAVAYAYISLNSIQVKCDTKIVLFSISHLFSDGFLSDDDFLCPLVADKTKYWNDKYNTCQLHWISSMVKTNV